MSYSSVSRTDSFQENVSATNSEVEWLAAETFRVLHEFVDPVGWGTLRKKPDEDKLRPKPVITKEIKRALAEWHDTPTNPATGYRYPVYFQDENGETTEDRFNFFLNYESRLWSPIQIQKCFDVRRKMYFTSSHRKRMAYLDGDAHEAWQVTDEVVNLFQQLFGAVPFYRSSPRGFNGWIKVICPDTAKWNESLVRLQAVLKKLRYQHRCSCDVEVKGGTNTAEKNANLGKLPCWNWQYPHQRHNADDCWNIRRIEEFKSKPTLTWPTWLWLIDRLESQIVEAEVVSGKEYIDGLRIAANPAAPSMEVKPSIKPPVTTTVLKATDAGGQALFIPHISLASCSRRLLAWQDRVSLLRRFGL
jgi:hypothetical protein